MTLDTALHAARLLGRWSLVAQRHGGGCSCCPGLGDVSMEEVESQMLKSLRTRHAFLEKHASFTGVLRDCVRRKPIEAADAQALGALFADIEGMLDTLENIQRGIY